MFPLILMPVATNALGLFIVLGLMFNIGVPVAKVPKSYPVFLVFAITDTLIMSLSGVCGPVAMRIIQSFSSL